MKTSTLRTPLFCLLLATAWLLGVPGPSAAAEPESTGVTLLTNVRIFDGKSDRLSPPSHVLVEGRNIAAISTDPIDAPAGARIIDGAGRVATPGFIDTLPSSGS